jgi:thiosulfate dehydrogenase
VINATRNAAVCISFTLALVACGGQTAARTDDPPAASAERGLALVLHTRDSLPANVAANLSCGSCHLDAGRRRSAIPLVGASARFPRYVARNDRVISLEDRVNFCIIRSLDGAPLPDDSRSMRDIIAYIASLSNGVTTPVADLPHGLAPMPPATGDSARGAGIFPRTCARCHGADGQGLVGPALWGARSYSIAASLARVERAAAFIRRNMPFDSAGTLTDQQAYDLAAFIDAHARPDAPLKAQDWPRGDAPADVPYATRAHVPIHPPPLLPRPALASAAAYP